MSARVPSWSVYDLFPTRCGRQIFIAVVSNKHWSALCNILDIKDMDGHADFLTNHARIAQRPAILERIAEQTRRHDLDGISALLETAGVPFSPVKRPSDLFDDPHMTSGGRMLAIPVKPGTIAHLPALPVAIEGRQMPLRRPPPQVGEHTDQLLAELGYSTERISGLRAAGAIR